MTTITIEQAYTSRDGLEPDAGQQAVVARLDALQRRLVACDTLAAKLRRRLPLMKPPAPVEGVYLWGDVGRGKTFLMDLFFDTLAVERKRRIHFHRMMADVHARLAACRDHADPLERVAGALAREAHVLCFDEFFVSDIGDAMILGRLLDKLFRRAVTLVATSNSPPSELYAGGLQRERFLPAIALLERHTQVIELGGDVDYRLRSFEAAGTWLVPAGDDTDARLARIFRDVAPGRIIEARQLDINGRTLDTLRAAKGVAWFTFDELCGGPRSQQDYIEIARWYQTVILSGVPGLDARRDDAARRFVALVDEFYDRRVKLVVSAAAPPDALYRGRRLAFEFQRTVSRLTEMQSQAYLHSAHRA